MPDGNRNILDNVTPTATLPRRSPGASGHQPGDNGPAIPKIPGLAPRPALPRQRLTATMNPELRDIDWNGHIPHAPHGPVTMTRKQVRAQLAAVEAEGSHERVYDRIVLGYGQLQANAAFGSAA